MAAATSSWPTGWLPTCSSTRYIIADLPSHRRFHYVSIKSIKGCDHTSRASVSTFAQPIILATGLCIPVSAQAPCASAYTLEDKYHCFTPNARLCRNLGYDQKLQTCFRRTSRLQCAQRLCHQSNRPTMACLQCKDRK